MALVVNGEKIDAAEIEKRKTIEAAQIEKQKVIEAADIEKQKAIEVAGVEKAVALARVETDKAAAALTLSTSAHLCRSFAILGSPFIPFTGRQIYANLALAVHGAE